MQHKEAEADGTVIPLLSLGRQECCTLSASILEMFYSQLCPEGL